ncbi:hypothetical protein BDK51DRAFT_49734 [Blyttiomyces helicus]|uniref:Uncharacterized protein n=1 Tax=Blyttiomyces helicus TaxID=388810 RepID=A0A4P9VWZ0_9FUNG|nr:hypothetical protein BDK51DRAFT_49734 [Blyttiomyces helicus]|eukprot:RKO83732.1 hypothetical protein BDK51DRAFT_49734 [Blyttiomyces helicus]
MSHILLLSIDMLLIIRVTTLSRSWFDHTLLGTLLIIRIGFGAADVDLTTSNTNPDGSCAYHQWTPSSLGYLLTDFLIDATVTLRIVMILRGSQSSLRDCESMGQARSARILQAVMRTSIVRSAVTGAINFVLLALAQTTSSDAYVLVSTAAFLIMSYLLTFEHLVVKASARRAESSHSRSPVSGKREVQPAAFRPLSPDTLEASIDSAPATASSRVSMLVYTHPDVTLPSPTLKIDTRGGWRGAGSGSPGMA